MLLKLVLHSHNDLPLGIYREDILRFYPITAADNTQCALVNTFVRTMPARGRRWRGSLADTSCHVDVSSGGGVLLRYVLVARGRCSRQSGWVRPRYVHTTRCSLAEHASWRMGVCRGGVLSKFDTHTARGESCCPYARLTPSGPSF